MVEPRSRPPEGLALDSAAGLADWARGELLHRPVDWHGICRVFLRETDRWFRHGLTAEQIDHLTAEAPEPTGDPRCDALLEGMVAHQLHVHGRAAPDWTRTTELADGWGPFVEDWTPNEAVVMSLLQTPAELFAKGVILPRTAFQVV
ncbi:MAG: hypothetical protein LBG60_11430 [Bifidobacteriaceae bacterium]|jgi:hypothetical protein|nr:hypothetical protein [Bifidobacteriaceae bacterium]